MCPLSKFLVEHLLTVALKNPRVAYDILYRRERLDFAISHKYWTVDDWKRVVWSDKTKIKWAWKKAGEGHSDRIVEGTVKFGSGSLMMWGCMM